MIVLEQLSRIFEVGDEQVHGLRQVDLTIGKGEYVAIMGPSGSGKSTLLNMIGLLDRPDSGNYFLENEDMTKLNDHQQAEFRRHKIGFIFQFFHLVPRMSCAENVELPLMLAGVDRKERKERVAGTVRITSYNVCYTKLLRILFAGRTFDKSICFAEVRLPSRPWEPTTSGGMGLSGR